jgi:LCP family protein required for cell wall assembly
MIKKIIILSLIVFITTSACLLQLLAAPAPLAPVNTETLPPAATNTPIATGLRTALTPTATVTRTPRPTQTPTASPTPRVIPRGRFTILVLGSDQRPGSGFRTDVILLLTVDTIKDTVSAVSFPRDLYVDIPGWKKERINTAFPHGGFELLADTFEVNFGLRPNYYIMTNMQGFVDIVDSLDGITVSVGSTFSDECPWSLSISDKGSCEVEPGLTEMDGKTALWYVRSRKTSNDFDRLRRAQEVLLAIFYRSMRLNAATRLPQMYNAYNQNVQTNMTISTMFRLLPTAAELFGDYERFSRFAITSEETTGFRTENRMAVLLPDFEKIDEILEQAVFAP